ncbi:AMP-binding protein [Streptomyces sp. HUAS ZL42]|uniref:AMP-binding protein n=1 Tax=Streptomyces sp. HUAS ZL42 TaxID=3231715 RepID=UPI00345E125D
MPQFTVIYFGILKADAAVVPLNVLLKAREVAYHLGGSDTKAYFAFERTPQLPMGKEAWEGFQDTEGCTEFFLIGEGSSLPGIGPGQLYGPAVAAQSGSFATVERDDEDTAAILYTSGTTGRPKGAELRHQNVYDNVRAAVDLFEVDAERPDTYLCVLPLFRAFGQVVVQNGAIAFGGTLVLQPRFEARGALQLMLDHDVTFFGGVPTMYWGLLGALGDGVDVARLASNLRVAVSGGSALPGEIHEQFKRTRSPLSDAPSVPSPSRTRSSDPSDARTPEAPARKVRSYAGGLAGPGGRWAVKAGCRDGHDRNRTARRTKSSWNWKIAPCPDCG